ncbi:MAG: hypothetical protein R2800_07775 [Flavipsychrobacter sp.]
MKKIILFAIAIFSITLAAKADNATNGANQTAKLALSNAIEIKFYSNYYGGTQTLTFNNVNDYANGKTSGYQILIIRSNKDYNVTVKANASNFSYSGSTNPAPVMPISKLNVANFYNGTGGTVANTFNNNYAPLSNVDQPLINNGKKGNFRYFFTRYKATPGFAYPAGTYTAEVIYTATQQ